MIEWCRDEPDAARARLRVRAPRRLQPGLQSRRGQPEYAAVSRRRGRRFTLVAGAVDLHPPDSSAGRRTTSREVARSSGQTAYLHSTWFLFDKRDFPMMQDFQNALYINDVDPTNAVIFDRAWLRREAACGRPHDLPGDPAEVPRLPLVHPHGSPSRPGLEEVAIPDDEAPIGRASPSAPAARRREDRPRGSGLAVSERLLLVSYGLTCFAVLTALGSGVTVVLGRGIPAVLAAAPATGLALSAALLTTIAPILDMETAAWAILLPAASCFGCRRPRLRRGRTVSTLSMRRYSRPSSQLACCLGWLPASREARSGPCPSRSMTRGGTSQPTRGFRSTRSGTSLLRSAAAERPLLDLRLRGGVG